MSIPELRRPLPDFQRWLDEQSGDERAPGYREFAQLVDLMERTQAQSSLGLKPHEASFLRMWQGMLMATVELCNREHKQGRTPHEITCAMPRVVALAAMYSIASTLKPDAPFRQIAKIVIEEFRAAAKLAADTLTENAERWAAEAAAEAKVDG